jgi:hypothetical protein
MRDADNAPGAPGELETLTRSTGAEITVGGETVTLTPLTFGELPRFLRGGREFLAALDARAGQPLDWIELIESCGESITLAIAIAARKSKQWVEGLSLQDMDLLTGAVMEVNQDFFARRLMAAMRRMNPPAPADAPSAGAAPASA